MKQFPLAKLRLPYGRFVWPLLLICVMAALQGCTSSTLQSIQIIPNAGAILGVGASVQFKALAVYTHGSHPATTTDVTSQVAWSSSIVEVATINATGYATAVAPGLTTITATGHGNLGVVTATTSVTVPATTTTTRDLVSIAITPPSQAITSVGGSVQFVAIGTYSIAPLTEDLTATSIWTSTNASVATINSMGVATGVSAGTSTIIASSRNTEGALITTTATATVTTTTTTAPGLVSVAIIPGAQTVLSPAEAAQFIAIGTYVNSSAVTQDVTSQVTWVSSDVSVATINAKGLATGNGSGTTAITALISGAGGAVIIGTATFTEQGGSTTGPGVATLGLYQTGSGTGTFTASYGLPSGPLQNLTLTCSSPTQCVGSVPVGDIVAVTATLVTNSKLSGWSTSCSTTVPITLAPTPAFDPNICYLTMTTNETVVAIFNLNP